MAGTLLAPLSGAPLERLVQVAMERGYTAQGEMFSGRLGVEGIQAGCAAGGDWRAWLGHTGHVRGLCSILWALVPPAPVEQSVTRWTLEPGHLGFPAQLCHFLLCGHGQAAYPLCASLAAFVQRGDGQGESYRR